MAPSSGPTGGRSAHSPGPIRVSGIDWWLDVRRTDQSFSGRVRIAFEASPDPLVVDLDRLTVDEATLDGRTVELVPDPDRGTVTLAGVSAAAHVLEIRYHGAASADSLVGLYSAPAGPSYVLTTMLFPTGSRRLLPSFEHPAIKTVYRLTLTTEPADRVIFNTPARSERSVDGRKEWVFEPTPPMSAYLLYLGIGPFDELTVPGGRWTARVAASPGRASAGRYAAERATEILAAYEAYYGIPYPLPKLDLVALENFWAGGMENWGAIAFRDDLLLVDERTGLRLRRGILATLAHEIAHQWFGNLVTNAWWDDFWLNESFATFAGYGIVQRRYPSEEGEKRFLIHWVSPALEMDGLAATHPVHVAVDTPDELGEHADSVTYGKGAAVLRMVEAYLGEETFRQGISLYLRRHQYANARAEDLWNALGEVARQPVAGLLTEWITRPGFPVIHAGWSDGTLRLRQERFHADGRRSEGVWPIPLRLRAGGEARSFVFDSPELDLPLPTAEGLRIDPGRSAFARVHYEGSLLDRVTAEFPTMDPVDQWGFVSDLRAFAYAGLVAPERLLDLLAAAGSLTDDLPIREVVSLLSDLRLPAHGVAAFEGAARTYLAAHLDRIGLEPRSGEPESQDVLREILVAARTRYDLVFARDLAGRFAAFDTVPNSLRPGVAAAYARVGGPDAFEAMVGRLRATEGAGERAQLLAALGSFEDAGDLTRALALIPSPGVTASGAYLIVLGMGANPRAGGSLFAWYRAHAAALTQLWAGTPLQSGFLHACLVAMGLDQEDEVRAYFAAHTPPDAAAGARLGLESLALAMRLRRGLRGDVGRSGRDDARPGGLPAANV